MGMREMVEEALISASTTHCVRPLVMLRQSAAAHARGAQGESHTSSRRTRVPISPARPRPDLDQAVLEGPRPRGPRGDGCAAPASAGSRVGVCRQVRSRASTAASFLDPTDPGAWSGCRPEALAQALGVKQQPHQGGIFAALLRAISEKRSSLVVTVLSPLGVGAEFRSRCLKPPPFARPHYRASTLVWWLRLPHTTTWRSSTCSRVPAPTDQTPLGSPLVTAYSQFRLARPRTRG